MSVTNNMSARAIVDLLAERHKEDVFVPECKDGPTWNNGASRLDAWAMRKSWANPCTWGYEVKISRNDWLRDIKWQGYTDLVNEFYLVAPNEKVIPLSEVPDGIGLLYVASTGTRFFTKRKAHHRECSVEAANVLMQYVLQSRASIDVKKQPKTVAAWKEWLSEKEENRKIGHRVSQQLAAKYERDVETVRREMYVIKQDKEFAEKVKVATEALGVRWNDGHWGGERLAKDISTTVRGPLLNADQIRRLKQAAAEIAEITAKVS